MLTGDLVRVRVDGAELKPTFVDPDKPALRERAEALLGAFVAAVEERATRGRLEEDVEAVIGDSRDVKLLRGIAKVLFDRSEFAVDAPVAPADLRRRLFAAARARGPLALERGPFGRPVAADVLAEIGAEHGLDAAQVAEAMYADLPDEQRITSCDVPDTDGLLHRYNVALVQAVLLHATEVRLRLEAPTVGRLRQLFRYIKFHQLVHHAERRGDGLDIVLDGPESLFRQSTRYGLQLASFFPAVLLQPGRWRLEATVTWTRARHRKRLVITPEDGLRSHYRDDGAWETREQRWFAERFAAIDTPWRLVPGAEPVDLGGKAVLLPDFTFTDGDRTAHLEIVGYWRKDWLARRVELLRRYGPGNLVLAVSRKLVADADLDGVPGEVVEFAEIVPPKLVLAAIERVAR